MIKTKKIIFLFLLTFIFTEKANTEIKDSLFMTVGDKPITRSDVVNEIKLILILNNQVYSDDKKDELQEVAVQSNIKRNVKLIELERNNYFELNEADVQKEITRLATNLFIDIETLKTLCESNGIDFSIIEEQVKIELYWNSLIFQLYKNRITIDPESIEGKLKNMQKQKKTEEYLISEIIIKGEDKENIEIKINELNNQIESLGFENAAKSLSISESALKGGDLGWINENIVSKEIRDILIKTPIGSVSEPVILAEGILMFKVRDKREIDRNLTLEEMKTQLVNSEKNKILNMHSLSHYDKVRRSVSIKFFTVNE